MENRAYAIATGFFVLTLGVLLLAGAYWLSRGTVKGVPYDVMTEESVAGLSPGAQVKLRGVEIGQVKSIGFDSQNRRLVRVRIAVDPRMPLMTGTYAEEQSLGISGNDYIELNYPDSATRPLQTSEGSPARIPMRLSGLAALTESGDRVLRTLNDTLLHVDAVISPENARHISRLMAEADMLFGQFNQIARDVRPAAKRINTLLAQAEALTGTVQTSMKDIDGLVVQVRARVDMLDAIRNNANMAGQAAHDVDRKLVNDTLPRIDALADRLSRNSDALQGVLHELENQPQSLIFGRPPAAPGPGEPGFQDTAQR